MTAVEKLRVQLRREMQAGDLKSAEETASKLAPFEDELCDELDRLPSAITPMWGLEA
jgi:hypothetical protein